MKAASAIKTILHSLLNFEGRFAATVINVCNVIKHFCYLVICYITAGSYFRLFYLVYLNSWLVSMKVFYVIIYFYLCTI